MKNPIMILGIGIMVVAMVFITSIDNKPAPEPVTISRADRLQVMLRLCYDGAWPRQPLPTGCKAFIKEVARIADEAEQSPQ